MGFEPMTLRDLVRRRATRDSITLLLLCLQKIFWSRHPTQSKFQFTFIHVLVNQV